MLSLKVVAPEKAGDVVGARWLLSRGSADSASGTPVETLDVFAPGFKFATSAPLGPNTYNLYNSALFASNTLLPNGTADYTFTFDVHPIVPEPACLATLAGGAMLLGRHRHRRRRRGAGLVG